MTPVVHYKGTVYRDLARQMEEWQREFPRKDVGQAVYRLVTFEGEHRTDVKPLAEVKLRPEVRRLCWQLLGPPMECWDRFYRFGNGEPGPLHAEKMAELERLTGKNPNAAKATKRPKRKAG